MGTQEIRDFINRHAPSVTALGALGAVLDARASGRPLDPALETCTRELLAAHGLTDLDIAATDAALFVYELRQHMGSDVKLLDAATRTTSWSHDDPRLLQACGDFSRNFARGLTANIVPKLDGLAESFTRFLDVGVGVASLSIELASLWPQLKITGIDVWQPSLALARANVAAAGLGDRITLREQAAEAIEDQSAFDLVWLPIIFMPERCVPTAFERARAALRPGGWTLLAFANWDVPDPCLRAFWRLRTTTFGGPLWTPAQVEATLRERGFTDVRTLPTPPGAPTLMAARRGS